jgi:hypothetical protein
MLTWPGLKKERVFEKKTEAKTEKEIEGKKKQT